jgi:hypothetical protein
MTVTGPVGLARLDIPAETGKARCSDQKATVLTPAAEAKMKARRVRGWADSSVCGVFIAFFSRTRERSQWIEPLPASLKMRLPDRP